MLNITYNKNYKFKTIVKYFSPETDKKLKIRKIGGVGKDVIQAFSH